MSKNNKLYYLKIEINEIKDEIKNLTEISSPEITGMPHSNTTSDPVSQYYFKKHRLIEKLNNKLEYYVEELSRVESIIDDIEDAETRTIVRLRLINNMSWKEISKKVHLDRSVCYKKIKKYL